MRSIIGDAHEKCPVAVYSTEEQKLIYVFDGHVRCGNHLGIPKWYISQLIKHKHRNSINKFNIPLAFRNASKEHITLLNNQKYIALDERYT